MPADRPDFARRCADLIESTPFGLFIVGVILANAVTLGLSTYSSVDAVAGRVLTGLEAVFLTIFVVEVAIRFASYGRRPQDFFRTGWNVFDLLVVGAAVLPGLPAGSTLLRLARIARITRVVRFFPALRAIVAGVARSLPGVAGFLVLSVLVLYVYGMVGWLLFADDYPADYGNIGRAVLTLFVLLSLETLPDAIEAGRALGDWTLLYFVSYVLIASYLLVNVLVAVIINSMEESRQLQMTERLRPDYDADGDGVPDEIDRIVVAQRLDDLRTAIISLERELRIDRDGEHRDRE
ncbi:ion transporter [Micromonospora sp. NBC_01813]|uniref:ion transporter n=1 Tax=Micromonospora sp. NBC_01813 TaxID=2975988 RepID=UPI002DD7D798|nr:ion transporter [Micromonospora sp. NBC_01813]WSA08609.1 ion transporter [Micromonospora sp. NBC_01813]